MPKLPLPPPPLLSGNLYIFFGRQKLIHILCSLIRAGASPPPSFGQCPKENIFFYGRSSLTQNDILSLFGIKLLNCGTFSLTSQLLVSFHQNNVLSSCVIILDSMYIAFRSRDDISVCQYIVHVGIKWFLSYFIFKLNKLHFSHSD